MNVLIIEDEPTAARRLARLLKNYDSQTMILDQLDTVETSVKWLQTHPAPDLILMDIKLADGMCFEIFLFLFFRVQGIPISANLFLSEGNLKWASVVSGITSGSCVFIAPR